MASTKTQIKAIRIANETAEYFEGKPLNRYVECLHHLTESGAVVLDGEEVKVVGLRSDMGEIGKMAELCGMTLEEILHQFCELLEDGSLEYDGKKIVAAKTEG